MPAAAVVIAHPSADVYGSDLQLLETVSAFVEAGVRTQVALPTDGPLVALLEARGATVTQVSFPVLRKSLINPVGLLTLAWSTISAIPRLVQLLRSAPGSPLLVNTVTIPVWTLTGRLCRRRTITHVHEAEEDGNRWVRRALAAPVLLSSAVVVNSAAAERALTDALRPLAPRRVTVVHNGVPTPPDAVTVRRRASGDPATLALVARISPRKGIDIALDAVGQLRSAGREVRLRVCGTVFDGYEWFEEEMRARAALPDLAGAVDFLGYVNPTWPVLADADVVLVPSRVEPFGNTAVEALHALRPLVASRTQGLIEIVRDGETGLLAEPGDANSLATAIATVLDAPARAVEMALAGHADAAERFSTVAYRSAMRAAVTPGAVPTP